MRSIRDRQITAAAAGALGHARLKQKFLDRVREMYPEADDTLQLRLAEESYRRHWKTVGSKGHTARLLREAERRAAKTR